MPAEYLSFEKRPIPPGSKIEVENLRRDKIKAYKLIKSLRSNSLEYQNTGPSPETFKYKRKSLEDDPRSIVKKSVYQLPSLNSRNTYEDT